MRRSRRPMRESAAMIDWERIERHILETRPYRWAVIDRLYAPADAAALAKSFPRDHFKHLSDYGGGKDFGEEARGLIGMGASTTSPPARLRSTRPALAHDLLSHEDPGGMSAVVGIDLARSNLE